MASFLSLLIQPFTYSFMLRGLFASLLVGVVCATVGTYIVLRGMAFFGDALAHSILPGIAIGYLFSNGDQGPLFWWSMATAILTTLGIGRITKESKLKEDTTIGIFFAGMFALGIVLISTVRSYSLDLSHFLFGNILGVSWGDLGRMAIFSFIVIFAIAIFYKELMVVSFDPVLATALRLPTTLLENLLLILIAITVVVSLQTVGIALMVAMLVTPPATAFILTKRLFPMMILAALIAAISGIIGLYISFYAGVASGATIVLVATGLFSATWIIQSIRKA